MSACPLCGRDVVASGRGRPPVYCGEHRTIQARRAFERSGPVRPVAGAGLDLLALTGAPLELVRLLLLDPDDLRPRGPRVRAALTGAWAR